MNGEKVLADFNRFQFWIDGNTKRCKDDGRVVSHEITIQNGQVIQSACGDNPVLKSKRFNINPRI